MKPKKTKKIFVAVRLRPTNDNEVNFSENLSVYEENGENFLVVENKVNDTTSKIQFKRVFGKKANQKDVYEAMKFTCETVLSGINSTVFAYGQTGSGKTYTMTGLDLEEIEKGNIEKNPKRGIVFRAMDHIFREIKTQREKTVNIFCSYFEIYNEKIYDLLFYESSNCLEIREDSNQEVFIPNLTILQVNNLNQVYQIIKEGNINRKTGFNDLNISSSRSHTIFQVYIEQFERRDGVKHRILSKLNLVDLAGSEKWNKYSKFEMNDKKILELTSINKSLSTLGKCINQLNEGSSHVSFRESKLTRLLQDSLGGNSDSVFIATLSPSEKEKDESFSTIKFAMRACKVVVNPHVNKMVEYDDDVAELVSKYQKEIGMLQEKLKKRDKTIKKLKSNRNNSEGFEKKIEILMKKENNLKEKEKKWLFSIPVNKNGDDYSLENQSKLKLVQKSLFEQVKEADNLKRIYAIKFKAMKDEVAVKNKEVLEKDKVIRSHMDKLKRHGRGKIDDKTVNIVFKDMRLTIDKEIKQNVKVFSDNVVSVLSEYLKGEFSDEEKKNEIGEEMKELVEGSSEALEELLTKKMGEYMSVLFSTVYQK